MNKLWCGSFPYQDIEFQYTDSAVIPCILFIFLLR